MPLIAPYRRARRRTGTFLRALSKTGRWTIGQSADCGRYETDRFAVSERADNWLTVAEGLFLRPRGIIHVYISNGGGARSRAPFPRGAAFQMVFARQIRRSVDFRYLPAAELHHVSPSPKRSGENRVAESRIACRTVATIVILSSARVIPSWGTDDRRRRETSETVKMIAIKCYQTRPSARS